ncbi:MAG TPA: hypothetical protein VLF42_14325 [Burkholderiales bacterium]|nr:hypothetical protein [Burkholderiales bacterium]
MLPLPHAERRHLGENSIYTGGGARAAWFKDSEGNILAVIQSI